jgi:hypothetical protein
MPPSRHFVTERIFLRGSILSFRVPTLSIVLRIVNFWVTVRMNSQKSGNLPDHVPCSAIFLSNALARRTLGGMHQQWHSEGRKEVLSYYLRRNSIYDGPSSTIGHRLHSTRKSPQMIKYGMLKSTVYCEKSNGNIFINRSSVARAKMMRLHCANSRFSGTAIFGFDPLFSRILMVPENVHESSVNRRSLYRAAQ